VSIKCSIIHSTEMGVVFLLGDGRRVSYVIDGFDFTGGLIK